jgi:RHS repeat-associated protein
VSKTRSAIDEIDWGFASEGRRRGSPTGCLRRDTGDGQEGLSLGIRSNSVIGRYYDPPTGQFLSVDPLVRQTQQPYLYAADNPVKFSDPTGLTWHLWMEQWLESGSNWTARGSFRSQTGYSTEAIIEVTGASSTPFYVVIDDNDPGSNLHRYHGAMRLS